MIALSPPPPATVRQSQTVIVRGHVGGIHGAGVELEGRQAYGKPAPWRVLASARPGRSGGFVLRWRVPRHEPEGPFWLRAVATRAGHVVAATRETRSFVGPAPVYCAPSRPPSNVPRGDGWITGGAYIEGGPYPGIYQCESQAYTITATNQAGQVVATQQVAARHSYTLILPAGRYSLKASSCGFGSATVTAGKGTHADAVCPVP